MSRQYFEDLLTDPPIANLTAVTATSETALWNVAQYSPIHAYDAYRGVGKTYRLTAGGIWTTGASGTLTITPRVGTTTSGITLGASIAQTVTPSITNEAWFLHAIFVVRTTGAPGANSTMMGTGVFNGGGAAATAASNNTVAFGGTSATCDLSVETGIFIGWTLSVAGSVTPMFVTFQSLN
jgi:hypothetical protein